MPLRAISHTFNMGMGALGRACTTTVITHPDADLSGRLCLSACLQSTISARCLLAARHPRRVHLDSCHRLDLPLYDQRALLSPAACQCLVHRCHHPPSTRLCDQRALLSPAASHSLGIRHHPPAIHLCCHRGFLFPAASSSRRWLHCCAALWLWPWRATHGSSTLGEEAILSRAVPVLKAM